MWCKVCQRGQKAVNGICPDCGMALEDDKIMPEIKTSNDRITVDSLNVTVTAKDLELGGGYTDAEDDNHALQERNKETEVKEKEVKSKKRMGRPKGYKNKKKVLGDT
jgi:hypothetical protein